MLKEDENKDTSDNSFGVTKYPCMPSLVSLQQMRNRLQLAGLGKKLMKWTSVAAMTELRIIALQFDGVYKNFAEDMCEAFIMLARCRYFNPSLNEMVIEGCPNMAEICVMTSMKTAAGVKVIKYNIIENKSHPYEHLGIGKGGQMILDTKKAWLELLKRIILMVQLRKNFKAVEEMQKSANKRLNVLSKSVMPRAMLSIHYILFELEEMEREDDFRLKRFKELKTKKASKNAPDKEQYNPNIEEKQEIVLEAVQKNRKSEIVEDPLNFSLLWCNITVKNICKCPPVFKSTQEVCQAEIPNQGFKLGPDKKIQDAALPKDEEIKITKDTLCIPCDNKFLMIWLKKIIEEIVTECVCNLRRNLKEDLAACSQNIRKYSTEFSKLSFDDSTFSVSSKVEDKLGTYESSYKETIKVTRIPNEDGTVRQERKIVTVRTDKRCPFKTKPVDCQNIKDNDQNIACSCYDSSSQSEDSSGQDNDVDQKDTNRKVITFLTNTRPPTKTEPVNSQHSKDNDQNLVCTCSEMSFRSGGNIGQDNKNQKVFNQNLECICPDVIIQCGACCGQDDEDDEEDENENDKNQKVFTVITATRNLSKPVTFNSQNNVDNDQNLECICPEMSSRSGGNIGQDNKNQKVFNQNLECICPDVIIQCGACCGQDDEDDEEDENENDKNQKVFTLITATRNLSKPVTFNSQNNVDNDQNLECICPEMSSRSGGNIGQDNKNQKVFNQNLECICPEVIIQCGACCGQDDEDDEEEENANDKNLKVFTVITDTRNLSKPETLNGQNIVDNDQNLACICPEIIIECGACCGEDAEDDEEDENENDNNQTVFTVITDTRNFSKPETFNSQNNVDNDQNLECICPELIIQCGACCGQGDEDDEEDENKNDKNQKVFTVTTGTRNLSKPVTFNSQNNVDNDQNLDCICPEIIIECQTCCGQDDEEDENGNDKSQKVCAVTTDTRNLSKPETFNSQNNVGNDQNLECICPEIIIECGDCCGQDDEEDENENDKSKKVCAVITDTRYLSKPETFNSQNNVGNDQNLECICPEIIIECGDCCGQDDEEDENENDKSQNVCAVITDTMNLSKPATFNSQNNVDNDQNLVCTCSEMSFRSGGNIGQDNKNQKVFNQNLECICPEVIIQCGACCGQDDEDDEEDENDNDKNQKVFTVTTATRNLSKPVTFNSQNKVGNDQNLACICPEIIIECGDCCGQDDEDDEEDENENNKNQKVCTVITDSRNLSKPVTFNSQNKVGNDQKLECICPEIIIECGDCCGQDDEDDEEDENENDKNQKVCAVTTGTGNLSKPVTFSSQNNVDNDQDLECISPEIIIQCGACCGQDDEEDENENDKKPVSFYLPTDTRSEPVCSTCQWTKPNLRSCISAGNVKNTNNLNIIKCRYPSNRKVNIAISDKVSEELDNTKELRLPIVSSISVNFSNLPVNISLDLRNSQCIINETSQQSNTVIDDLLKMPDPKISASTCMCDLEYHDIETAERFCVSSNKTDIEVEWMFNNDSTGMSKTPCNSCYKSVEDAALIKNACKRSYSCTYVCNHLKNIQINAMIKHSAVNKVEFPYIFSTVKTEIEDHPNRDAKLRITEIENMFRNKHKPVKNFTYILNHVNTLEIDNMFKEACNNYKDFPYVFSNETNTSVSIDTLQKIKEMFNKNCKQRCNFPYIFSRSKTVNTNCICCEDTEDTRKNVEEYSNTFNKTSEAVLSNYDEFENIRNETCMVDEELSALNNGVKKKSTGNLRQESLTRLKEVSDLLKESVGSMNSGKCKIKYVCKKEVCNDLDQNISTNIMYVHTICDACTSTDIMDCVTNDTETTPVFKQTGKPRSECTYSSGVIECRIIDFVQRASDTTLQDIKKNMEVPCSCPINEIDLKLHKRDTSDVKCVTCYSNNEVKLNDLEKLSDMLNDDDIHTMFNDSCVRKNEFTYVLNKAKNKASCELARRVTDLRLQQMSKFTYPNKNDCGKLNVKNVNKFETNQVIHTANLNKIHSMFKHCCVQKNSFTYVLNNLEGKPSYKLARRTSDLRRREIEQIPTNSESNKRGHETCVVCNPDRCLNPIYIKIDKMIKKACTQKNEFRYVSTKLGKKPVQLARRTSHLRLHEISKIKQSHLRNPAESNVLGTEYSKTDLTRMLRKTLESMEMIKSNSEKNRNVSTFYDTSIYENEFKDLFNNNYKAKTSDLENSSVQKVKKINKMFQDCCTMTPNPKYDYIFQKVPCSCAYNRKNLELKRPSSASYTDNIYSEYKSPKIKSQSTYSFDSKRKHRLVIQIPNPNEDSGILGIEVMWKSSGLVVKNITPNSDIMTTSKRSISRICRDNSENKIDGKLSWSRNTAGKSSKAASENNDISLIRRMIDSVKNVYVPFLKSSEFEVNKEGTQRKADNVGSLISNSTTSTYSWKSCVMKTCQADIECVEKNISYSGFSYGSSLDFVSYKSEGVGSESNSAIESSKAEKGAPYRYISVAEKLLTFDFDIKSGSSLDKNNSVVSLKGIHSIKFDTDVSDYCQKCGRRKKKLKTSRSKSNLTHSQQVYRLNKSSIPSGTKMQKKILFKGSCSCISVSATKSNNAPKADYWYNINKREQYKSTSTECFRVSEQNFANKCKPPIRKCRSYEDNDCSCSNTSRSFH